jgi:hypothetical protein
MKNLVLSAILLAGATALTGCVAAGEGDVQASWALKSTNLSAGGAIIAAPCPVGGDTVLINAMDSTGFVYTDAYFCTDGVGIADRLPEDIYRSGCRSRATTARPSSPSRRPSSSTSATGS